MAKKLCVMLVYSGKQVGWNAVAQYSELAEEGLCILPEQAFAQTEDGSWSAPAIILAQLTGNKDLDVEVCETLTSTHLAPVIAISPESYEDYVLAIFRTGVDDFIRQPVKTRELAARIRTILKRTQPDLLDQLNEAVTKAPNRPASAPQRKAPGNGILSERTSKSIQGVVHWLRHPFHNARL